MTDPGRSGPLDWSEIYERLARRPERPDPLAWAALERRVRAWTRDDEVAAETCAEVWRTFNLARGGASFEGFVQGRFVVAALERGSPGVTEKAGLSAQAERLAACLEELRVRNPRHHDAIVLLYEDRATAPEAADALGVDVWTVRTLAVRARQALAQCLERADRRGPPGSRGQVEDRSGTNRGRSGEKPGPPRTAPGRSGGREMPRRRGRQQPRGRAE